MHGFRNFKSAARFCWAFDELRNSLRCRQRMGEIVPLAEKRRALSERLATLQALFTSAS